MVRGIVPVSELLNVSPTIYLESYYEKYKNGYPMKSIMREIAGVYNENKAIADFDLSLIKKFTKAKEHIYCDLCNYDLNKKMLEGMPPLIEGVPHKRIDDLAVYYRIRVPKEYDTFSHNDVLEDMASIRVNDMMLKYWDISLDTLDSIARENTKKLYPPVVLSLQEFMVERAMKDVMNALGLDEEDAKKICDATFEHVKDVYLVTNTAALHGAVHILDAEVMEQLAEKLGDEFYVIPSSIHEALALPKDHVTEEEIKIAIRDANSEIVTEEEVLSQNLYVVDAKNHIMLTKEHFEEYKKEQEKQKEQREEQLQEQEKQEAVIKPPVGPKL